MNSNIKPFFKKQRRKQYELPCFPFKIEYFHDDEKFKVGKQLGFQVNKRSIGTSLC